MTSVSLERIATALGMTEQPENDAHIWASVDSINADNSYQVILNGSTTTTRANRLCDAFTGDRVLCVLSRGQLSVVGRVGVSRSERTETIDGVTWRIIEHASGLKECFARKALDNVTVTDQGMSFPVSSNVRSFTYPSGLFTSTPACSITYDAADSGSQDFMLLMTDGQGTSAHTPRVQFGCYTARTVGHPAVSIIAKGY